MNLRDSLYPITIKWINIWECELPLDFWITPIETKTPILNHKYKVRYYRNGVYKETISITKDQYEYAKYDDDRNEKVEFMYNES